MNSEKLMEIDELLKRWKNHMKFLNIIKKSNIEKEVIDEWVERINNTFRLKIKSKL